MRPLLALALALATAALVVTPIAAQSPQAAKAFSDRMQGLTEIQRFGAIRRAVQDNGQWCPRVTAAAYQQTVKNLVMWVAHCASNNAPTRTMAGTMTKSSAEYGLFIGPDGSVQAAPCNEVAKVKWPACKALPAAAPPKKG